MTDREKLIEMVRGIRRATWHTSEEIADHLLANGVVVREKPATNADRIRAMSDEELAFELLVYCPSDSVFKGTSLEGRAHYSAADGQYYKNGSEAVKANLDWLRLPVKDGEGDG